ncbi:hypothetical protein EDB86DRAFT_2893451 [Lactarius hatsudake]|nr:hypothetical protein EDB86DRAFT_2893451 [Lactarius hatsudake]
MIRWIFAMRYAVASYSTLRCFAAPARVSSAIVVRVVALEDRYGCTALVRAAANDPGPDITDASVIQLCWTALSSPRAKVSFVRMRG